MVGSFSLSPAHGHQVRAVAILLLILPLALFSQEPPVADPVAVPATEEEPQPEGDAAEEAVVEEPAGAAAPAQADPFAVTYLKLCAGCHTIGGGPLSGPDLLPSTRWPREDLRVAVKRMEVNVGPMTDEEVDGLTDLLKAPDVQQRLDAAREQRIVEMAATLEPGVAAVGRRLFFGERRFRNGGMGCFACHAVAGRGGNMAIDLTAVHQRLGQQSVISATEQPAFPMMRAAYGAKPVTSQEAAHLAAFFEQTAAGIQPGAPVPPPNEGVALVHAGAGGFFIVVLAGVALLARTRRAGVRSRLIRDSYRR
jgi:ubiquinol-cytochrome c reductase cytochrome c subunit